MSRIRYVERNGCLRGEFMGWRVFISPLGGLARPKDGVVVRIFEAEGVALRRQFRARSAVEAKRLVRQFVDQAPTTPIHHPHQMIRG